MVTCWRVLLILLDSYPEEEVKTKRDHSKRETIKRKKSKHSAKGKKRESSCGRRPCVLLLVVACVVALCYAGFLIYKWSSRSTCNVFGVSYPKGTLFTCPIPRRPAGVGSSDHLPEIDFCHHLWRRFQQCDLPRGRIQYRYLVDDSGWLLFPFLTHRCAKGHADHVWRQLLPEAHEHQAQGSGRSGNVQYRKGLIHCSPEAGSLECVLCSSLMTRFPRVEERDHRRAFSQRGPVRAVLLARAGSHHQ